MERSYSVSNNVQIPMRDGVNLCADVFRPDVDGPVPAILLRTPYDKNAIATFGTYLPDWLAFVRAGYAVVLQDTRGSFASEGTFVPHLSEVADGQDTLRWLTDQAWCDGQVGMFGISYLGMTQWQLASTGAPGLKAIAPSITTADFYRAPWHSPGGALSLETALGWGLFMGFLKVGQQLARGEGDYADVTELVAALADLNEFAARTPVADQPLIHRLVPAIVDLVIDHPDRDENWRELSALDKSEAITAPALITAGWYDLFIGEQLRAYVKTKSRAGARLILGPWSHETPSGKNPDRSFGPMSAYSATEPTATHLAFFDAHLRGQPEALAAIPPVQLFVMGIDEWRAEQDWPLPDTTYTPFYLGGEGAANTANGSGIVTTTMPADDKVDTYLYDPNDPVPSLGGTVMGLSDWGPQDQRPVHHRDDVLCFSTPPLGEPLEVTGPVTATLYVSSSATDTDFTAKLVDVHPDGRAIVLCDGIVRMRYRDSLSEPELMEPDTIYEVTVDLLATSNVFLPGHRLLVEISSSNFPRYDRNSNTGGVIAHESLADMQAAVNRLYRGPKHPSHILLPIIAR